MNAHITKQFLQLANNLSTIDPEIQLCLGLLFYTKDDFDKTIDCFESALRVNPNDELMWNRLGLHWPIPIDQRKQSKPIIGHYN